jgi:D-amino peptidase
MKLLIADDMEGISGVVNWDHVTSTHSEYGRFRKIMTAEINAAIAGAVKAGVDEIMIADGHGTARNILIEDLDSHARLNSGAPSPFSMVNGIESGVDAAMFIGYHARAGTQNAILAHTWSSSSVVNLWLNDRLVGETGLNASVCGYFGAPVLLVSGDQAVCAETAEWLPGTVTVAVKRATGFQAAECLPPSESQARIREASEHAVQNFKAGKGPIPLKTSTPVRITIEFSVPVMADRAALMPGANRLDGRRVEFQTLDMPLAYRAFRSMVEIAS